MGEKPGIDPDVQESMAEYFAGNKDLATEFTDAHMDTLRAQLNSGEVLPEQVARAITSIREQLADPTMRSRASEGGKLKLTLGKLESVLETSTGRFSRADVAKALNKLKE